ncbi:MAG: hypothetical protein ACRD12_04305 [Acidimicrobiales bacterium]
MGTGSPFVLIFNGSSSPVNLAYMRVAYQCMFEGGEPWEVRGWRFLNPGEVTFIKNPTANRWLYVYAESWDGHMWTGPFLEVVPFWSSFRRCTGLGLQVSESAAVVGFLELDTKKVVKKLLP